MTAIAATEEDQFIAKLLDGLKSTVISRGQCGNLRGHLHQLKVRQGLCKDPNDFAFISTEVKQP